jgi:hypothetical protein
MKYAIAMSKMKLRNVPEPLLRMLKARAAVVGMSLSDYLLTEIRRSRNGRHWRSCMTACISANRSRLNSTPLDC